MTIKDIAKKARVSIGTVDRVIHKRGRVSRATEEKVRLILEEMQYKPNAFAQNLKRTRVFTFGILTPEPPQDGGYWEIPMAGIEKAGRDFQSYNIRTQAYHFDRYSEASFVEAGDQALADRVDGLVIAPVLPRATERFITKFPPGLAFVFIDSSVPTVEPLSFIGQDPFKGGVLAASLMKNIIREGMDVAVLRVLPEDYHIDQRAAGFIAHYRACGIAPVFTISMQGEESPSLFTKRFAAQIESLPDLEGIFVTDASMHRIVGALQEIRSDRKFRLIGYDLIPRNVRLLREGLIDFLISQKPDHQGYRSIDCLCRHFLFREKVENRIMMPLDILTRENIDYYQY
jgi:LacI family transcriptional regulator